MPITLFSTSRHFKKPHYAVQDVLQWASMETSAVLDALNTSVEGLSEEEAENRLKQYGPNTVAQKRPAPWWLQLLRTFNSPFNYLLAVLGVVSVLSGNMTPAVLIVVMILLSVALRFFQEYHSNRAAEKLKRLVTTNATVYRAPNAQSVEIPIEQLVPGDIVQLRAGDLIPADIRLLEATHLHINQSALTGESLPVEKEALSALPATVENMVELPNICFMGTSVNSGMGRAVILATGDDTYFGNLVSKIILQEPPSSFDRSITQLSWLLIRMIVIMVGAVFLINGVDKQDWLQAFLFALAVGVGLTPEMLPMIVTANLSRGAMALSAHKVIVKRLSAIQDLGSIDVLCTDKTGTLTQNKVMVYKHLDIHGEERLEVLQYAFLNSYFESGLKNLLDEAILEHAQEDRTLDIATKYTKISELPFDFERRRLSVVLESEVERMLICKGAVEEMLTVSSFVDDHGQTLPLTPDMINTLQHRAAQLNEDGFRLIGVAYKRMEKMQSSFSIADEQGLTLVGFMAFLDPPKESTAQAITVLQKSGVELKILTGDNPLITRKICQVVNLPVKGMILGGEIDQLSDEALTERVEHTTIFAKLTPEHKERLILALKKRHVVGFLGDGINDSPALKAADIGLSVDNAVDIAKESADMILMEQNLLILGTGIREGRKVYGNVVKYIRMNTSSNFGNVLSMVGASLILPFLPMLPIHILTQNLLYDFSQTTIPFDRMDESFLERPHQWRIHNIERFMLMFGPVSSIFDYCLFGLMWFVLGANTVEHQALFQSGWFVEGLISQTLIIHLIRTEKMPFLESRAAPQLIFSTVIIISIAMYLPFSPIAPMMKMVPLPPLYFMGLLLILAGYVGLTQWVKSRFIQKYGYD